MYRPFCTVCEPSLGLMPTTLFAGRELHPPMGLGEMALAGTKGAMGTISLTLFNILLYINAAILRICPKVDKSYIILVVLAGPSLLASAYLTSRFFDPQVRAMARGRTGERRRIISLAALGVVLAAGTGIRFLDMDPGRLPFMVSAFFLCCIVPPTFYLFFLKTDPKHQGADFGVSLAIGLLTNIVIGIILDLEPFSRSSHERLLYLQYLSIIFSLFHSVCLFYGFFQIGRGTPPPLGRLTPPFSPDTGGNGRTILRLLGAVALFCSMSGFLSARLMPMLTREPGPQLRFLGFVIAVASVIVGILLDANRATWFRRFMQGSALTFMLVPSLIVLGDTPYIYRIVHTLASVSQFVLFICATIAVAGLADGGRWWCFLVCCPFVLRFLSFPGVVFREISSLIAPGVQVTVSILASMAFYFLVKSLCELARTATPGVGAEAGPDAEGGAVPHAMSLEETDVAAGDTNKNGAPRQADDLAGVFSRYNLTVREVEVVEYVMRGLSSAEIAARLSITEHTVNTHVRNILRKFNLSSRKLLVAKLLSGALDGGEGNS